MPPGEFHNIHTISDEPSCYMYIFVNETARQYIQNMTEYEQLLAIEQETNNEHDAVNSQKNGTNCVIKQTHGKYARHTLCNL